MCSIGFSACGDFLLQLTELGDVFYQCWQYSEMCGTVSGLNKVYYHGLKLWVHEACSLNPVSCCVGRF